MEQLKKIISENPYLRWFVCILISLTMAANYYFYDALSPLKSTMEGELGFSSSDYGFLMSTYSFTNTFLLMAVLGGIILDKLGIRRTGFGFVFFMVAGSFLTAYGASDVYRAGGMGHGFMASFLTDYSPELKMMSLGFLLFGLGAETSIVVISKVIVKWFKGKELALALGVNLALGRIGSFLAFYIFPYIKSDSNWTQPIWIAALLMAMGFLAFLIYLVFDIKIDRQLEQQSLLDPEDQFQLSDLVALIKTPSFIYITLLCVTFYSAVFPFLKYAPDLLENKFGYSPDKSSQFVSLVPLGTIALTPFFGFVTDKFGKSARLMIWGSVVLILVFGIFTFTNFSPEIPLILLGISFSLIPSSMWPSVAKIVETSKIGSAYGFMFSVQNLGLWAFPMLIGYVLDASNPGIDAEAIANGASYNYTNPLLMLLLLGVFGLICAFLLLRADKRSDFGLDLPNVVVE